MYGLRQAPRAWNAKLDATLDALGFTRSSSEHAVYIRRGLLVGVYVDDLLITGLNDDDIRNFKGEMMAKFYMSDLGLLTYYLGIEVHQSVHGITLGQAAYARKILEKADMLECNPCHAPMEPRLKLSKDSQAPPTDASDYRSLVGSFRYLVQIRPDISFAVGYVSRFMEASTMEHLTAVKHILRYVLGTIDYGCSYRKSGSTVLSGFSDSDMGGDPDTRKSTTGLLWYLGDSPVSWQSQVLSSCEAEYMAATAAACYGVWLTRLLKDLTGREADAPTLKMDNKPAIALAKNPVHHDRSKHIDLRLHFIRNCVEEKKITGDYISTELQLADILTKPLGRVKFQELRSKLGITKIR